MNVLLIMIIRTKNCSIWSGWRLNARSRSKLIWEFDNFNWILHRNDRAWVITFLRWLKSHAKANKTSCNDTFASKRICRKKL